ncbi:MAG TPA: hypothetical protein PLG54_00135 [Bacteroidales bacterium]|nr:hypothetical protein [Bacteroidales bacterium]NMD16149.1 hypothetical protein [Bacteroidales bacterium]HOR03912.1 hypothetical protein [Bacteroidales bacterium]HOU33747.1 hypothetical protein [Bacteroidales bacterium]HQI62896.1 hypothetical protein [Bacteroidales bacterium]
MKFTELYKISNGHKIYKDNGNTGCGNKERRAFFMYLGELSLRQAVKFQKKNVGTTKTPISLGLFTLNVSSAIVICYLEFHLRTGSQASYSPPTLQGTKQYFYFNLYKSINACIFV